MGLFDFIFNRKKQVEAPVAENKALDKVAVMPGITIARAFADNWTNIAAAQIPFISIDATPASTIELQQSKLAHYPKIPIGFNYPKDKEGNPMFPLAQINFSEVPALEGYPSTGLLQIYISVTDDVYGINFENNQLQENFRVVFFEEAEVEKFVTDFSFLQEVMDTDRSPVYKPHTLKFSEKVDYIGLGDVRFENSNIIKDIINKYPGLEEELEESLYDDCSNSGHKIGGYAYFTQEDPRLYNNEIENYILLLQIDTDDEIMWGDSGVANFFIDAADLAKKDFSKVIYNWDCC